jgi:hypothetical protein
MAKQKPAPVGSLARCQLSRRGPVRPPAAISVMTNCLSIVVSSSTGQVTLFRRGLLLPLAGKAALIQRGAPGKPPGMPPRIMALMSICW